ncbi:hypothetical protein AB3N02_22080 [Priestia aryabhattai]|uniref:hypothetical protein n=1 Tax=Priestia aryabhattai TaxID=412384 RepID=UPI0039A30BCC
MKSEQTKYVVEYPDKKGFYLIMEHPKKYPAFTTDLKVATGYESEEIAQVFIDGLKEQGYNPEGSKIKKLKITYELEEC